MCSRVSKCLRADWHSFESKVAVIENGFPILKLHVEYTNKYNNKSTCLSTYATG